MGMRSSSAAICSRAVLTPWPNSALPVAMVTPPSTATLIQESSSGLTLRLPGRISPGTGAAPHAVEKPSTSDPASTPRREISVMARAPAVSHPPLASGSRPLHRAHDPHMRAAAA